MLDDKVVERISILIEKCLSDSINEVERAELYYYLTDDRYQQIFDQKIEGLFTRNIELLDMDEQSKEAIFDTIVQAAPVSVVPIRPCFKYKAWMAVAATFIMMLSVVLYVYLFRTSNQGEEVAAVQGDKQKIYSESYVIADDKNGREPLPAKDKALFVSEDIKLSLEDLKIGESKTINGILIEKKDAGNIVFSFRSSALTPKAKHIINSIITPRGSSYKITLPDGGTVDLNSSSKLEFPSVFASQERKVLLEGEAFFAVKKNPDKAFIVVARNRNISQEVLVYGTTFNVNAYAETKAIVTTLVEGSVKVRANDKEVLLRPSQQSVMGQDSIMVSPANIDMNLSWRNNLFYFAETAIQYVMSQISRWYDVDIVYDSEMPEFKLTGITLPTKLAYYRITDVAKDIDKASLFAFSSTQKILFYAVGSKLYGYDYNLGLEKLYLIEDFEDEITMINCDIQQGNGSQLYVATYNPQTKRTIQKYITGTNPNNLVMTKVADVKWEGLLKVKSMTWRNSTQ